MSEFLLVVWDFQYALVPCFVAYIVFDSPIIVRRVTRKMYVPIYFAFFPIGYSDELLARYFDEDYYWVAGGPFSEDQLPTARLKIIAVAVFSLSLTMTISPLAAGIFANYVMTEHQFEQFVWTLAVVKAALLIWAYYDMRFSFNVSHRVPIGILAVVYFIYWALLIYFTVEVHNWVGLQHSQGGIQNLTVSLLDFVIKEMLVGIVFASVIGALVAWWITERRLEDG